MIEDILTQEQRIRLEALAQSVAKHKLYNDGSAQGLINDAREFEKYVRGEDSDTEDDTRYDQNPGDLSYTSTRRLLTVLSNRMKFTQSSALGVRLAEICDEMLVGLDSGILDYRPSGETNVEK